MVDGIDAKAGREGSMFLLCQTMNMPNSVNRVL